MAEINIYGYIGEDLFFGGVSLQSVSEQLNAISDKDLTVNISSGGGSVNEGKAIYNLLKNSGKNITVKIIGQAYSIASVIAMAGNKILIAEFADMMVHPAWTFAEGNADALRQTADQLEEISNELFNIYMVRENLKSNETKLREYFDAEKIISAKECIELGLADGYLEDSKNQIKRFIPLKAVAYYSKQIDMKQENLDEAKGLLQMLKDGIKNMFSAKNTSTVAGETTFYYNGNLEVGTAVFSDEAMTIATTDGVYGDYTVSDGKVSAIAAEPTDEAKQLAEAQAKVSELQAALDVKNAEVNALNEKFEQAETKNKTEIEAINANMKKLETVILGEEGRHREEEVKLSAKELEKKAFFDNFNKLHSIKN